MYIRTHMYVVYRHNVCVLMLLRIFVAQNVTCTRGGGEGRQMWANGMGKLNVWKSGGVACQADGHPLLVCS